MKIHFLVVIFFILCYLKLCQSSGEVLAVAICEYIKNHFVKNAIKFDFIVNYNSSYDDVAQLDSLLKQVNELESYKVLKVNDRNLSLIKLERSAIFILDSFESYQRIDDKLDFTKDGSKQIELLIYCKDLTTSLLTSQRNIPSDKFQVRCFVIIEEGEVYLKSLELFTPLMCNKLQLVTINVFSRKSMKWMTSNFFETKIRNFFGCELVFGVLKDMLPASHFIVKRGKIHVAGYNVQIVLALNNSLNFVLKFQDFQFGKSSEMLPHRKRDHVLGSSLIDHQAATDFAVNFLFIDSFMMIIIPPGEPYTDFEKLFLPFDQMVWILFATTFVTAFTVTLLVKYFTPKRVQDVVFGENVSSPGLNIIVAFMGGGQIVLPIKSFARFILMVFILFSLIMRTAYQGKYFEFLTSDVHKPEAQSIDELVDRNFTLFFVDDDDRKENVKFRSLDILKGFDIRGNMRGVTTVERDSLIDRTSHHSFKGCVLEHNLFYFGHKLSRGVNSTFLSLEQKIISYHFGFLFIPHHFLFPIFDEKIQQLINGGFIDLGLRIK